jgi:hypothetical protein
MASLRQIAANRRNGRLGGPKTEAGKERSRANSIKHGLTSSTLVVLPEEDEAEYREVLRGFRASFNPQDEGEDALVLRLAQAHWRTLRSRRVETGIFAIGANVERARARETVENCPEHLNPHEAIAVGFMTRSPELWQTYLRYDNTISRDFFRTLDALMKLQRIRDRARSRTAASPSSDRQEAVLTAAASYYDVARDFSVQSADSSADGEWCSPVSASKPAPPYPPCPNCNRQEAVSSDPAQLSDSGIRSVSQTTLNTSKQKEHHHESQQEETIPTIQGRLRPTLGCARPVINPTPAAIDRFKRKERHLQRLLASARVLPRFSRRANQRNRRPVGGRPVQSYGANNAIR